MFASEQWHSWRDSNTKYWQGSNAPSPLSPKPHRAVRAIAPLPPVWLWQWGGGANSDGVFLCHQYLAFWLRPSHYTTVYEQVQGKDACICGSCKATMATAQCRVVSVFWPWACRSYVYIDLSSSLQPWRSAGLQSRGKAGGVNDSRSSPNWKCVMPPTSLSSRYMWAWPWQLDQGKNHWDRVSLTKKVVRQLPRQGISIQKSTRLLWKALTKEDSFLPHPNIG